MTPTLRWGLSVLDWHDHAIDDHLDHPIGVLKARCGHLLMMVTPLRETCGTPCPACAATVTHPHAEPPHSGRCPPCSPIRLAETCPGCGATQGVRRITGTSPEVDAWMCECGMHWAITVINPP